MAGCSFARGVVSGVKRRSAMEDGNGCRFASFRTTPLRLEKAVREARRRRCVANALPWSRRSWPEGTGTARGRRKGSASGSARGRVAGCADQPLSARPLGRREATRLRQEQERLPVCVVSSRPVPARDYANDGELRAGPRNARAPMKRLRRVRPGHCLEPTWCGAEFERHGAMKCGDLAREIEVLDATGTATRPSTSQPPSRPQSSRRTFRSFVRPGTTSHRPDTVVGHRRLRCGNARPRSRSTSTAE